jgi:hypothetical protein
MTYVWARAHPLLATDLGLTSEDGSLDTPSSAENARDLAQIRAWEARLDAISLANATVRERDDATLLRAMLVKREREYTTYRSYEKDYSEPAQAIVAGLFTQFQQLPVAAAGGPQSAASALAWRHIVSRLSAAPAYIAAGEALASHPGHLQGVVGSEELAGVPDFFGGALTAAARAQLSASDFTRFGVARDRTLRAIADAKTYIDAHVATWPDNFSMGRPAYDAMLHDEQLLPYDAGDVERLANVELAHGWTVQTWAEDEARRRGTPIGPQSGGGLAPGGAALVDYYRDRLDELAEFVRSQEVVTIPAWLGKIAVVETPKFLQPVSPGASMNAPLLLGAGTGGFYYITPPKSLEDAARRLDPNEDFDRDRILSTGAHEAMPGHFLQLSIARRNPDFVRKIQTSDVFAEGWAFYGEEMFVDLGLFGDRLDGRYYVAQWERVRGARAIVDTKLASGEWSYDRAVAFFAREAGFPEDAARAQVARIALDPGALISYTVGREQLEALLSAYRERMGDRATLLDFHDRLLSYGTTPFSVVGPELLGDLDKPASAVMAAAS